MLRRQKPIRVLGARWQLPAGQESPRKSGRAGLMGAPGRVCRGALAVSQHLILEIDTCVA